MVNLNDKIQALKEQNQKDVERKIRELTIKEQLNELTGLDFMVLIHSGKNESISIWIDNDQFGREPKFDRFKIKEYYNSICTLFTPVCKPLTFASSKEIENFAPAKIEFDNNTSEIVFYHPQTVKISFYFDGNITVSFKLLVNSNPFSNDILGTSYFELKPYNKVQKMGKNLYYLDMFGKVRMSGNAYQHYCEYHEQLEEFMSVVFYGHIPQFAQGFINGNIS